MVDNMPVYHMKFNAALNLINLFLKIVKSCHFWSSNENLWKIKTQFCFFAGGTIYEDDLRPKLCTENTFPKI